MKNVLVAKSGTSLFGMPFDAEPRDLPNHQRARFPAPDLIVGNPP
jgi:hypothetical protein